MDSASFFITPKELWTLIGTAAAPLLIDTRRRNVFEASPDLLPAALWRDSAAAAQWAGGIDAGQTVVVACKEGHELSQVAAATLRSLGINARVLAGGHKGWKDAGLPFVAKTGVDRFASRSPSLWVTRRRPKIDRVACPWLIRRFIDPDARIMFVEPADVLAAARESGAIPFDIEGVELSHEEERCTFDTLLKIIGLEKEPSLARLALIVRGADTARPDLAPEAAGLHAISLGLSALAGDDDHAMLRHGFIVYDALYAWLRFAAEERHNWPAKAR